MGFLHEIVPWIFQALSFPRNHCGNDCTFCIASHFYENASSYAIWTGIGAVGVFLVGLIILGEPANIMRVIAAILIVSGLLMMKRFS